MMSGSCTCFCGLTYTFGENEGNCPNCGCRASLNPDTDYLTPIEEKQILCEYQEWLDTYPVHQEGFKTWRGKIPRDGDQGS